MLSDFSIIKSCFGDDDDPNDTEKFEIKNKRDRKIVYNPDWAKSQGKKKKVKHICNTEEKKVCQSPTSPSAPVAGRKMTMDDLSSFLLSDIKEVKSDYEIEYDYGNKEYKLKLCDVNDERIEGLVTQMKFRLEEGGGECFYEIGVEDNGNPLGLPKDELELSVETLKKIVEKLEATATVTNLHKGKVGLIAEVMIKQKEKLVKNDKLEIKIGLLGEESSGKSTLIGVLISNKLDNGKGLARFNVFRHKHEILCGKTSSISHQILGFDENGELTNYGKIEKPSWAQIVNKSAKILNFYDMGGTNKNFNKTMTAFSPNYLDYLLLVVSAEKGITDTTEDLLNFSTQMDLPIITIFTKMDLISEEKKKKLVQSFKSIIIKLKLNRVSLEMKTNDDIVLFSRNIQEKTIMPMFFLSNLNWSGLDIIKSFLSMLPVNEMHKELERIEADKTEFDIHETLAIENKLIVTGIVNKGKLMSGTKCYLGPDLEGRFKIIEVVNIHCKKIPVKYVYKGQYCSLYIQSETGLTKEDVRKGMVLLDLDTPPQPVRVFEAELWTIDGSKRSIKYKYQPVLNIKHIRQGCKIKNINELISPCEESNKISQSQFIKEKKIKSKNDFNPRPRGLSAYASDFTPVINYFPSRTTKIEEFNIDEDCDTLSYNFEESFELNSTTKTKVVFEFMFNPEYLTVGSHVMINDQRVKAFGIITNIID